MIGRQTSTSEKNYHSLELELLAVVGNTRHFGYLLLGISFAIITDCNAVQYTMKKEENDNTQYCKTGIEATGV